LKWPSIAASLFFAQAALAQGFITVASTTSTEQSGLYKYLLPRVKSATGVEVRVVAVGTGQALDIARRGDADLVIVHDPQAETRFVEEGFGIDRRALMHNDFVLVGPKSDPANARGNDIAQALRRIAAAQAPFASRGDRSGTHTAELRYWKLAGIEPGGGWYREMGSGMGATLNSASAMNAYTISDRGTWLSFRNRGPLTILVEGDPPLFNPYDVILVNPERHPHVKKDDARRVMDYLVSPQGQAAIAAFRVAGEQLFFPDAGLR
jgi:tungstate transport system substrate-binding protein